MEHILQKLIQEFALGNNLFDLDVSSILKKSQNNSFIPNEPQPPPANSNSIGIITSFQYIRDYIK